MANSLLTINQITRKALALFRNSNAFLQSISRQYDDQFANSGAKIGTSLRIRLPNDYTIRTGPTAVPQDTVEQNVSLTVATQKGVDVSFSSADLAMSLDDFGDRILAPMVNNLAGSIASDVMSGAESIPNFIHNVDGSNNTISPTFTTWATANGVMNALGAPMGTREVVVDPISEARTVSSFSGLFNNQDKVGRQYTTGRMGNNVLGFDWSMDQTVIQHTTGSFSAGTVNGGSQSGTTITTNAITGTLNKGDVITFAGVFAVNRVTKSSTGQLAQFVVTANVSNGATSIPIYPAITPGSVAFQTVTASPANSAAIALANKASEVYRKNFVFSPQAVTLVTADLPLPTGAVVKATRERYDGISMRMISDYLFTSDQQATRLDILYGYAWVRPEWAVVVADAL